MKQAFLTAFFLTALYSVGLTQKLTNQQKASKYKTTYVNNLKKCVVLANDIAKADSDTAINRLREQGKQAQVKAWDAFLYLQDPELKFPIDKIRSMKGTNEIFWGNDSVFSDERNLKLPSDRFKAKVAEQLDNINSALPSLENF
jgi:hypothetical protein